MSSQQKKGRIDPALKFALHNHKEEGVPSGQQRYSDDAKEHDPGTRLF